MLAMSGQIMKKALGSFSVNDNLQGLSKDTKIVMLTDGEGLG